MLANFTGPTLIENLINQYFLLYRSDIMTLSKKWWKEEDYKEKSLLQYQVMQYYNCMYYVILIYIEVQRGVHNDWQWYEDRYKITKFRHCFGCNGIDLDAVFAIFNLPLNNTSLRIGIEHMMVESTNIVEPTSISVISLVTVTNIVDLLAYPSGCTTSIISTCPSTTN